jgi:hypothetical protein
MLKRCFNTTQLSFSTPLIARGKSIFATYAKFLKKINISISERKVLSGAPSEKA